MNILHTQITESLLSRSPRFRFVAVISLMKVFTDLKNCLLNTLHLSCHSLQCYGRKKTAGIFDVTFGKIFFLIFSSLSVSPASFQSKHISLILVFVHLLSPYSVHNETLFFLSLTLILFNKSFPVTPWQSGTNADCCTGDSRKSDRQVPPPVAKTLEPLHNRWGTINKA